MHKYLYIKIYKTQLKFDVASFMEVKKIKKLFNQAEKYS